LSQQVKSEFLRNFSETLKAIRTRRGWSQEDLAEQLGVAPSAVSNWETMANGPTRARLKVIADRLGVSLDYLTHGAAGAQLREEHAPYGVSPGSALAQQALDYFVTFLDHCGDDPKRLGWTLVELESHFPHDKWESKIHVPGHAPSRRVAEAARASQEGAARAAGIKPREEET
jgi:transcriptional regulator with XRE-family HTH domain